MSSVSLATGPGPQKPLGRADCLREARYFLRYHLSLSPHNDSPRSSLLMFVIALSHKGDDQWSRAEHRRVRRCRIAVCPFNTTGAHYRSKAASCNALKQDFACSPLRFHRESRFICLTPRHC